MKIGICLPYLKEGLTREDYLAWFRAVDDGPFHSVCCGERVHGPSMDMRMVLAAAAAATSRVEITPTLYVLPMHSAVGVAKEVATLDLLSGGRVPQIVVGYGGREQDYEALGAPWRGRYRRLDRQVAELRRVWRGEEIVAGAGAIGPAPTRPGGPRILAGATSPKSITRCAPWADGLYYWTANAGRDELERGFGLADEAWAAAGRGSRPYRMGGCWYTLAADGQQLLYDYVYDYLALAGPAIAALMAGAVRTSSADAVRRSLDDAEAAGCEELFLVPATAGIGEVEGLTRIMADRG